MNVRGDNFVDTYRQTHPFIILIMLKVAEVWFVSRADLAKWGYFNQNVTSQPANALSPLIISNFIIFAYFFRDSARLSS